MKQHLAFITRTCRDIRMGDNSLEKLFSIMCENSRHDIKNAIKDVPFNDQGVMVFNSGEDLFSTTQGMRILWNKTSEVLFWS